jgi:hypothetical protein
MKAKYLALATATFLTTVALMSIIAANEHKAYAADLQSLAMGAFIVGLACFGAYQTYVIEETMFSNEA